MFEVHYIIRKDLKSKKDGTVPVFARSRVNSSKLILKATGVKVKPGDWSDPKQRSKSDADVNTRLNDLEKRLKASFEELKNDGFVPTLEMCWNYQPSEKHKAKTIIDWAELYLKKSKASVGQRRGVKTMIHRLDLYNPKLRFTQCTGTVLTAFVDHMNSRGVQNNSAYKSLRALHVVAKFADQDNAADLLRFKMPYKTKNGTVTRINWSEVKIILATKTETPLEKLALDVFEIACFTGLRISDILSLPDGDLSSGWYYEKIQEKTGEPVFITTHDRNRALLSNYYEKGINYSRQKLGDALKDVLERSELNKKVTRIIHVGSSLKKEIDEKWNKITFHSGRRFYASLLSELGLSTQIIADELGHTTRTVTEHYVGSAEHRLRIKLVRDAVSGMEKRLEELESLMKVA
jgi:integrase